MFIIILYLLHSKPNLSLSTSVLLDVANMALEVAAHVIAVVVSERHRQSETSPQDATVPLISPKRWVGPRPIPLGEGGRESVNTKIPFYGHLTHTGMMYSSCTALLETHMHTYAPHSLTQALRPRSGGNEGCGTGGGGV